MSSSRGTPPPVPPARGRPSAGVLAGGRRRRRPGRLLALLALFVAFGAAAAGAYLALTSDGSPEAAAPAHFPAGTPPAVQVPEQPTPLVPAEPVPEVPLSGADAVDLDLRKPPRAGLVFDVETGAVLWRRRPVEQLPVASLTKIMTALVVTAAAGPDEPVRITSAALSYQGSGVGLLPRGKRVRLETLLGGLMIVSGNDAAIALSVHVAGSERRFVRLMNERARRWGLECTRFVSSHGLEPGNRSCAADLAVLTRMAVADRRIARVARRRQAVYRFPIKGRKLYLSTHNPLFRLGYPGAIGLKTGYTDEAGRCFVGVARRGGRTLAVVLLDSRNPGTHAAKLLDEGFAASGT
jgi:serine-type D-Ala-D-Ala carboxypeptidase (penicillin-binding protein 5/6)